ncbi:MAG: tRNA uridine-5-carboxymethylaminomethyl(34) synthesis GTPase MnmE [Opitutaceae bacterium]
MPRFTDTIAALATPAGTAAIAMVRITGPDTSRLAKEIGGRTPLPRRARHVDYRDRSGAVLDDIIAVFFPGPRSYTGEDTLEISCHGNPFIVQQILADLWLRGCRPAEPGEFTQRAFLNGRMDLSQAEAVMDLIQARSERALAVANRQLRGALGERMNGLIEALLGVLARIEAYIDFPEEGLPAEDRGIVAGEIDRLGRETARLLATSHYGEVLRDGIKTVIAGAPNVGKSSLLNRLVGRERALVSPEPGTTRDFIEERIVAGPHGLRIIDTAGLNPSPAPLERLGMEMTRERLAEADLLLLVLDATKPDAAPFSEVINRIRPDRTIVVLNKIDLGPPPGTKVAGVSAQAVVVQCSALTGMGVEELFATIIARANEFQREAGDETIAVGSRHARALTEARECLAAAREKMGGEEPVELLASDLRGALAAFGEIMGKVDNERMLNQLFAAFCIGK